MIEIAVVLLGVSLFFLVLGAAAGVILVIDHLFPGFINRVDRRFFGPSWTDPDETSS